VASSLYQMPLMMGGMFALSPSGLTLYTFKQFGRNGGSSGISRGPCRLRRNVAGTGQEE